MIFRYKILFSYLFITIMKSSYWLIGALIVSIMILTNCKNFYRQKLYGDQANRQYYTHLYFGEPPVQQSIIIDTGSATTYVPCQHCVNCDKDRMSRLYDIQKSFKGKKIRCNSRKSICAQACKRNAQFCEFYSLYADGTELIGTFIQDVISFQHSQKTTDQQKFTTHFGCIDYEKYNHEEKINGIIGLGPDPVKNFLYQWFNVDSKRNFEFSVCLADQGGFIQYGKSPQAITYNHVFKYEGLDYYILKDLKSINYGRQKLINQDDMKGINIIVDTGSSIDIYPQKYVALLIQNLIKRCQKFENCQATEVSNRLVLIYQTAKNGKAFWNEINKNFENIQINIQDQTLIIQPQSYLILQRRQQNYNLLVLSIINLSNNVWKSNVIILGITSIRNRKITFNVRDSTVSIANNFNCTFQEYIQPNDGQFRQNIKYLWSIVQKYQIYIAIACFALLLLAIHKICRVCVNRRRNNRKELNEEIEDSNNQIK